MYKVVNKQILTKDIKRLDVVAVEVAKNILPGQFIVVAASQQSEKIPLSVVEVDPTRGIIALVFQEVNPATRLLGNLKIGDEIFSVQGPLGSPIKIEKKGVVVCLATDMGVTQVLPFCRSLKQAGNKVIAIMGAKSRRSLILMSQLRLSSHKLFIVTEDGSYERKGSVTSVLKEIFEKENVKELFMSSSVEVMRTIAQDTFQKNIKAYAYLNLEMVDGIGLCGSCRVRVDNREVLACVDGPVFDAHKVDYNYLKTRIKAYAELGECLHPKSSSSPQRDESRILKRFLSGILKS